MDSESTVNLLIQDIDDEVMHKEITNINRNDMNTTDPEEPLDLPGNSSNSSMDSVKHVDISQVQDDPSDTSTNIESNNHYDLAAPVKIHPKTTDPLVTPDLRNGATEVMSGPTLASTTNRVYMNRSPNSSTERLREMLKEEADDIETEIEQSVDILFNPTAPKRFSLGSTKPLLPFNNPQGNDHGSIARYVSNSDGDDMDYSFSAASNEFGEQSPLVQHSPFKIPVSNTVTINRYTNTYGVNDIVEDLSNSTFSDNKDSEPHSISRLVSEGTDFLSTIQPPSIPPTPEMRPFIDSKTLDEESNSYSKKLNTRIFSMATTIGDYESALEQQSDIGSMVQCIDETDDVSESDIIDTLNISSTTANFEKESISDNDSLNNNTFMSGVVSSIGSVQLEKESESCDNSTSSNNESESVYKISLENEKLMEYTNKKILQAEDKIENIIKDTNIPISTLPILPNEKEEGLPSKLSVTSTDVLNITTDQESFLESSSRKNAMEEDADRLPLAPKHPPIIPGFATSEPGNTETNDGSLIGTLPEIDVEITGNAQEYLMNSSKENNENSILTDAGTNNSNVDDVTFEENQTLDELDSSLALDPSPILLNAVLTLPEMSKSEMVQTLSKDSNIVENILPEVPGFEPLHLESPFDLEADSSFGSTKSEDPDKPTNYLNVWHIQESSHMPERKLSVTSRPVGAPKSISRNVSSYSFKPRLVHRPKIHYSDSSTKTNVQKDPLLGDDCIAESFSTDFEYLLNQISTDDHSFDEMSQNPSYGRLNIWNKDKDILHPSITKSENTPPHKKLNIEQVIGQDEEGIMKSQVKNVIIGKASSIKSFQVESDDNVSFRDEGLVNDEGLGTPEKYNELESIYRSNENHIESPFKVVLNESNNSPSKMAGGNPFFTSNMRTNEIFKKNSSISQNIPPQKIRQEFTEPPKPVVVISKSKGQDELDEFIVIENGKEDPPDNGIIYVLLNKINVELSDVARHDPKFSLEIDNGINVVNTPWKALSDDKILDLGKELEIPIRSLNQTIYLTLKCQYTRPQFELYEVMEKVKTGKKYHGLGKTNYRYEKRYKQKKVQTDDWDYTFAPDGSFGSAEIHLDEKFLSACKFNENKDVRVNLENKWGRLKQTSQNLGTDSNPLKRKPYVIGNISLDTCYLQRSSPLERFPKSLKLVHDMVGRLKSQRSIKKEGSLLQEGGDILGLLKKRYFKLEGNTLTGYHEISRKAKIDINLLNAIDVIDSNDFQSKKATNRDFTNLVLFGESFKIIFNDGEIISFNSDTSAIETRDWYNKIKESIALNVVHQPWVKKIIDYTL